MANVFRIVLGAALLALASLSAAQERETIDEIVALVEEDVILRSELDLAIDSITQQVRARGESLPPRSVFEEQVLERLILQRLEIQRAQATGIRVSDSDVDQALNQVAQQNNISVAALRTTLEEDGYDFGEFRQEIREELLSNRLRQRIIDSMDSITDTEIDILLTSERFGGGEYHISQILIAVPETATPLQVEQARERAAGLYRELRDGTDFASLAISHSQAPEALDGGEIGWRNVNTVPTVFADTLDRMQPGQVSEPVRSPSGFVILRLNDRRDSREVIVQEFRARHLMVEPSELLTADAALLKIERLHRELEGGADFEAVAREHSDDETSANIGGLLNWFPRGAYGDHIQQVLDSLQPGQISQPFQTFQAWHVIKLEEVREADRTAEAMRAEARNMLRRQKADGEIERFLRQMRDESFVEVRL